MYMHVCAHMLVYMVTHVSNYVCGRLLAIMPIVICIVSYPSLDRHGYKLPHQLCIGLLLTCRCCNELAAAVHVCMVGIASCFISG